MIPSTSFLLPWALTWCILFVVFLVVADTLQRYFYDLVVDRLAWRVLLVSPILAAVLVCWPLSFEDVFMKPGSTLLQMLIWFVTCWLALRFQWAHAAVLAIVSVALAVPVTSSTIESLFGRGTGTVAGRPAIVKEGPAAAKEAVPAKPAAVQRQPTLPGRKPAARQPAGFPRQPGTRPRQPAGYPRQPVQPQRGPAGQPAQPAQPYAPASGRRP